MPQRKVLVVDVTGAKRTPVELPDDVPMRRLIPALVTKMSLPTMQGGNPLIYKLDHKRSGKRLADEDTLITANVEEEDVLRLLPEPTAGGVTPFVRLQRLQSDYDKLKELVNNSDLIHIAAVSGSPPERYEIVFNTQGIARLDENSEPVLSNEHRVEIYLHSSYPRDKPSMRWLTPIFHPNIGENGAICTSEWYASKMLDELVLMLGRMSIYDPEITNPGDALNYTAADWAAQNSRRFPTDTRPLRTEDLSFKINLGASSEEGDILDSIQVDQP